uniref:Double zinc ribbon and ankyrin repeat domains 1 n=1 Tax=Oryzias melastigma TaxID=30732 RepID=A0A3B3BQ24_ORYME
MAAGVVSAPLIIPIIHLKTSRGKTRIDTRTPVSMQSDTAGALIFFTLDGSKPLDGRGGSAGSSRKYSKPILLPSGRVHVKAVAVTSDSRQSSVVTKVFVVDPAEDGDLICLLEPVPRRKLQVIHNQLQVCSQGLTCSHLFSPVLTCTHLFSPVLTYINIQAAGVLTGSAPLSTCRCAQCLWFGPSDPMARFCAHCGAPSPAPPGQTLPPKATPSSDPAPSLKVTQPTADKSTQTVGLHYPSFLELQRRLQTKAQQGPRDPQPPLTAVSPGRGFWRKQLDHVCGHLRSYAQNNPPFRALLGEPRFGRVRSSLVSSWGFVRVLNQEIPQNLKKMFLSGPLWSSSGLDPQSKRARVPPQSQSSGGGHIQDGAGSENVPDSQLGLLKELGPGGGRISTVQRLLDQGADPSRCGSDGRHLLAVAVMNGHPDVLPVLLQRGADADQQSGPCKASVRRRNAVGQTPYDVAASSGCGDMVSLLAAGTGPGSPGRSRLSTDGYQPLGRGQGFSV